MHEGRLTGWPGMIASNEAFVEEKAEQAHRYWNGVIKYVLILISKTGVGLRLWKKSSYTQIPGKAFSNVCSVSGWPCNLIRTMCAIRSL